MANNNKVRVMRIKDGSLLDEDSLAVVAEMAHAHDFQVWIESVETSGNVGIYMEDGEVKAVNPEPLDEAPNGKKKKTTRKKKAKGDSAK
jgi:hypothetical protein